MKKLIAVLVLVLALSASAFDSQVTKPPVAKSKISNYILGGLIIAGGITIGTLDFVAASTPVAGSSKSWSWDTEPNYHNSDYHNTIYLCVSITAVIAGIAEILR